jgi:myosin heavy subunit
MNSDLTSIEIKDTVTERTENDKQWIIYSPAESRSVSPVHDYPPSSVSNVSEEGETDVVSDASPIPTSLPDNNIQILLESLKEYDSLLKVEKAALELEVERLEKEINLMASYFHSAWSQEDVKGGFNPVEVLKNVVNKATECFSHQSNKKRKRALEEEEYTVDSDSLSPIVYFNVEGEIFTILRSTILRVIPDSQLAVRVSGRWEEQVEKGDIDEEGNLIVHCHKESFRPIISALLMTHFTSKIHVSVNSLCRNVIEETLNYLLITPQLLTYTDPYF